MSNEAPLQPNIVTLTSFPSYYVHLHSPVVFEIVEKTVIQHNALGQFVAFWSRVSMFLCISDVMRCFQSCKTFHSFRSYKTASSANILYGMCIYKNPASLLSIYPNYVPIWRLNQNKLANLASMKIRNVTFLDLVLTADLTHWNLENGIQIRNLTSEFKIRVKMIGEILK